MVTIQTMTYDKPPSQATLMMKVSGKSLAHTPPRRQSGTVSTYSTDAGSMMTHVILRAVDLGTDSGDSYSSSSSLSAVANNEKLAEL